MIHEPKVGDLVYNPNNGLFATILTIGYCEDPFAPVRKDWKVCYEGTWLVHNDNSSEVESYEEEDPTWNNETGCWDLVRYI